MVRETVAIETFAKRAMVRMSILSGGSGGVGMAGAGLFLDLRGLATDNLGKRFQDTSGPNFQRRCGMRGRVEFARVTEPGRV